MGCGVAPLAGITCEEIAWVVRVAVWGLLALLVLGWAVWLRKRPLMAVSGIAVAVGLVIWGAFQSSSDSVDDSGKQAYYQVAEAFEKLCYDRAFERIDRKASDLSQIVMTPERGPQGAYQFDLFYSAGRWTDWNGIPVVSVLSMTTEGPQNIAVVDFQREQVTVPTVAGDVSINGVRMVVKDIRSGTVLGERLNFLWGDDFNRGAQCLGASWFADNQAFLERVLGELPPERRAWLGHGRVNQRFVKATLVKQEEVVHTQLNGQIESLLPGGSKYDYNNRAIHLPGGSFKMPLYGNSEPIPIVASRDLGDRFAFIMRPDGASHNRAVQQLMIHYRSKSGEELMNTIVSIPPAIDWRSGWGFDEATVKLTDDRIEFSFSGDKVHGQDSQEWADLYNLGQYAKRYTFAADLPKP